MNKRIKILNCICSDTSYFTDFLRFRRLKSDEYIMIANWNIDETLITLEYSGTQRQCFIFHVYHKSCEMLKFSFDTLHGFLSNIGENKRNLFYWDFQQRIFAYGDEKLYLLFITSEDENPVHSKRIYVSQNNNCYQIDALEELPFCFIQTIEEKNDKINVINDKILQLHMLTPYEYFLGGAEEKKEENNIHISLIGRCENRFIKVGDAFLSNKIWENAISEIFLDGNCNFVYLPEISKN